MTDEIKPALTPEEWAKEQVVTVPERDRVPEPPNIWNESCCG